jgi:hypothetical protein
MSLSDYPGYIGRWSGNQFTVLIHADWPNYPAGEGSGFALAAFGRFPPGTDFELIDDIDRCVLFIASQYKTHPDIFDSRNFHVAAWHDDLIGLAEAGYITGVQGVTEREWEMQKRGRILAEMRRENDLPESFNFENIYYRLPDGTFKRAEMRPLDEYDEDDEEIDYIAERDWLGVREGGEIKLTQDGLIKLEEMWRDEMEIPQSIDSRIRYLLDGELYDSALRDLGALAETKMRELSGLHGYGQRLVDEFITFAGMLKLYSQADIKVLRSELRTAFKFYRNEFAHNIVELPKARAYALVSLMCDIIRQLDEFKQDLSLHGTSSK